MRTRLRPRAWLYEVYSACEEQRIEDGKTQAEEGGPNLSAEDVAMLRFAAAASSDISLLLTLQRHMIR
jgi:hypothetical protein